MHIFIIYCSRVETYGKGMNVEESLQKLRILHVKNTVTGIIILLEEVGITPCQKKILAQKLDMEVIHIFKSKIVTKSEFPSTILHIYPNKKLLLIKD